MDPMRARLACFCFCRGVCDFFNGGGGVALEVDVFEGVVRESEEGFASKGGLGGAGGGTTGADC